MFAIEGSAGPHFLCNPEGRTLPRLPGLAAGATVLGVPWLAMTSRQPLPLSSRGLLLVASLLFLDGRQLHWIRVQPTPVWPRVHCSHLQCHDAFG